MENTNITVEIIKIAPDVLWSTVSLVVFYYLYTLIKKDILPNMNYISAYGVDIHLLNSTMISIIEVAEKNDAWKVEVSQEDKDIVIERARKNSKLFEGVSILWFDDRPDTLINEIKMFSQLGVSIKVVKTLKEALKELEDKEYSIMISDIARENEEKNGIEALKEIAKEDKLIPTVFYIGSFDPAHGTPPYAFSITNRPDILLHYVMDILERKG